MDSTNNPRESRNGWVDGNNKHTQRNLPPCSSSHKHHDRQHCQSNSPNATVQHSLQIERYTLTRYCPCGCRRSLLCLHEQKQPKHKKALVDFNLAHAKVAAEIKKQNKDIEKQVNESTASEITKIKMLQSTIHNTSKSYAERKKAIQQMQSIVPSYHASITKEGRLFNENTAAIDTYIRNLRRAARAEAAYEKMKANEIKILNDMDTVNDARQKGRNVRGAAGGRGVNLNEGEE